FGFLFQIDFSARPVDPIFRRAREQLENSREYRDATSPPPPSSHHMSVDRNVRRHSASLKEVDVVRQASERIQNSALHAKSSTHNVASTTSASISASSTNSESIAHSPLTTKINSPASTSATTRKASPARTSATSTDLSYHGSTKATKADRCSSKSPPRSRISPAACRSPANTSAISLASPPTLTAVNNSRPGSSDRRNSSSDSKHHTNSDVNNNNSSKNSNDNDHSHASSAPLHGTKAGSLSTDSEELNPKEEKVLTENTNGMNRVFEDDYDTTSDYSPDEKRLRIASVEDE
ncbi:unnamed protein product, partial [Anisakis simplex]|uniref:MAP/microtubule affinity-regulating kinase 3 n=1 Tax=Anisakis simplex TaxID=6269 RepID=A0A0M3KCQ9_ANISI